MGLHTPTKNPSIYPPKKYSIHFSSFLVNSISFNLPVPTTLFFKNIFHQPQKDKKRKQKQEKISKKMTSYIITLPKLLQFFLFFVFLPTLFCKESDLTFCF